MTPEPATVGAPADERRIQSTVAAAVLETPGVTRIEPTLRKAVKNIAHKAQEVAGIIQPLHAAADGVQVVVHDDASIDLTVEIGISTPYQALKTATAVRQTLRTTITELGYTANRITISVLSIDRSDVHLVTHTN